MNNFRIWTVIFLIVILQSVQNDLRLLGKSYKNFAEKNQDFISKVENIFKTNKNQLESYSMLYMEHHGDTELIRKYFISQYVIVPKLISDKKQHASLAKLEIKEQEDKSLGISITAHE